MDEVSLEDVCEAIQEYLDPHLNEDLLSADAIKDIRIAGRDVEVDIELGFPCAHYRELLVKELAGQITENLSEIDNVKINLATSIAAAPLKSSASPVKGVKNIIGIYSARGGCGKTTLALNFALALAREGAKVGLLEVDPFSNSALIMLGAENETPEKIRGMLMPIIKHSVNVLSLSQLDSDAPPMLLRGPQVANALRQLLDSTLWGELDYLLLDLPSHDEIFHAISRVVPIAGVIMIAMPHRLSQIHTRNTVNVLKRTATPLLGLVENMSLYLCPYCGRVDPVWGDGGVKALADELNLPLIGSVPLMRAIRQKLDSGDPTAIVDENQNISHALQEISRKFAAILSRYVPTA